MIERPGVLCTGGGRELNLILLDPPAGEALKLGSQTPLPRRATLLNNGLELQPTLGPDISLTPPELTLRHLPADRMNDEIQVIRLQFDDAVIHPADVPGCESEEVISCQSSAAPLVQTGRGDRSLGTEDHGPDGPGEDLPHQAEPFPGRKSGSPPSASNH